MASGISVIPDKQNTRQDMTDILLRKVRLLVVFFGGFFSLVSLLGSALFV